MGMMIEALCPGVEHSEEADLSSEAFGIGGHFQKSLSYGAKQNPINDSRVLQGQRRQFVRQSEYYVRIGDRQNLLFAVGKPLIARPAVALRAVSVATRNGELTITCLMGSDFLWGVERQKGRLHAASHPFDSPLRLAFQKRE